MIELLGFVGSTILVLSSVPQVVKSYKEGHANGLAHCMIRMRVIGLSTMLLYVVITHPEDLLLIGNYGFNTLLAFILFKYKYFPVKRSVNKITDI